MSNLAKKIEKLFINNFPSYRIQKEKYIFFNNTRLFFDFYIPEMKLLIEVQGQQHYSFNKFYHNDKDSFDKQKIYDKLKEEWASDNKYNLLQIKYNEVDKLTDISFKKLIIGKI